MAPEMISISGLPAPGTGAAYGVRADDTIFLSGLNGLGPDGEPRDLAHQARGLFENARLALNALEADLSDVVQCRFYLTDWRALGPLNDAYAAVFAPPYNARTTVRSASLGAPGALLEACLVAVVGGKNRVLGHAELFKLPIPLAQAGVLAGERFFGTGLVAVDTALQTAPTIGAQTDRALENQALALEAAGMSLDDVIKATVYLRDPRHLEGMLATYDGFFRSPYPALSIQVATLARPDYLVEVEVIASRQEKRAFLFPGSPTDERSGCRAELIEGLPPADQAESAAVLCDGWLYTGALMGFDWLGRSRGAVEQELAAELEQLGLILKRSGSSLAEVVFTGATLSDWRLAPAFEAGWAAAFGPCGPARLAVEGLTVNPELLVQLEAVARLGAQDLRVLGPAGREGER